MRKVQAELSVASGADNTKGAVIMISLRKLDITCQRLNCDRMKQ